MTFPSTLAFVSAHILALQREIANLQLHIDEISQGRSSGIQNVFDRFLWLERRQDDVESLVRSDLVKEYLKLLPATHTLKWAIQDIQRSELGGLKMMLIRMIDEINNIFYITDEV
jgi:hypothetical protein